MTFIVGNDKDIPFKPHSFKIFNSHEKMKSELEREADHYNQILLFNKDSYQGEIIRIPVKLTPNKIKLKEFIHIIKALSEKEEAALSETEREAETATNDAITETGDAEDLPEVTAKAVATAKALAKTLSAAGALASAKASINAPNIYVNTIKSILLPGKNKPTDSDESTDFRNVKLIFINNDIGQPNEQIIKHDPTNPSSDLTFPDIELNNNYYYRIEPAVPTLEIKLASSILKGNKDQLDELQSFAKDDLVKHITENSKLINAQDLFMKNMKNTIVDNIQEKINEFQFNLSKYTLNII